MPLFPGAEEAVRAAAERWPLGLASSANRPLIDLVLELTGLAALFRVTVSSEEVPRGKPAPDVYLEAARRLGWSRRDARRSRTPPTGFAPRAQRGCASWPSLARTFRAVGGCARRADDVLDSLAELVPALERVA